MKIGILQTGHAPDEMVAKTGDYPGFFERLLAGEGFEFEAWPVVDGVFPPGPEAADGWLITGSRHGVYEELPWLRRLEALVREIVASGRPLVGICFGHQIIATALGGRVEKFAGGWAVGRQIYDFGGETYALNAWHQDQVVEPPEGARVIASNAFCPVAGMTVGDAVFSIQPHPEFSPEFLDDLMTHRGGAVPPERIAEARKHLAEPLDARRMAHRIAEFFKQERR